MPNKIKTICQITKEVTRKDFVKKDGKEGFIIRLFCNIGKAKGKVFKPVVFWSKCGELVDLKVGDIIEIEGRIESNRKADGTWADQIVGTGYTAVKDCKDFNDEQEDDDYMPF